MSGASFESGGGGADPAGGPVRRETEIGLRAVFGLFRPVFLGFRRVVDPHQREAVRRSAERAFILRARRVDEVRQLVQRDFPPGRFMGGACHEAHHLVEEARSGEGDEDVVSLLLHLRLRDRASEVVFRDGARFIAAKGREGPEVMRSRKKEHGLFQGFHAPGQRTVPGQPRVKRAEDARAGDAVAVGFSGGAEPGMEAGGCVFRVHDPDGMGKAGVEGGGPFVRRNAVGIRRVHMKNLAQGMHAGIRPAGTVDADWRAEEGGKGAFQDILYGTAPRLALPAQVRASIVRGGETDAGHGADCVGTVRFWQEASAGR